MLEGRALHEVGGHELEMVPGDVCFIPRGEPHSLACLGDETLVILWAWGGASSVEAAGLHPGASVTPVGPDRIRPARSASAAVAGASSPCRS